MVQGVYGTYLHLMFPDVGGGYRVHPGACIQEDPSMPPVHLGPTEILGAQPAGEGVLVPIVEGSLRGGCPLLGAFGVGPPVPLPGVAPLVFGGRGAPCPRRPLSGLKPLGRVSPAVPAAEAASCIPSISGLLLGS